MYSHRPTRTIQKLRAKKTTTNKILDLQTVLYQFSGCKQSVDLFVNLFKSPFLSTNSIFKQKMCIFVCRFACCCHSPSINRFSLADFTVGRFILLSFCYKYFSNSTLLWILQTFTITLLSFFEVFSLWLIYNKRHHFGVGYILQNARTKYFRSYLLAMHPKVPRHIKFLESLFYYKAQ